MTEQPASRWRRGSPAGVNARGAADRVRLSHAQARVSVRLALAFIVSSALVAMFASNRWLPLHLFLAGGVVLAISGVSLMLTVTWAAAPAPPDRWAAVQRWSIAAGAAGIGVGREAEWPDAVVGAAGALYVVGLVLLGGLLALTVRRGVERRFDVAVAAYLAAIAAGLVGVVLGITMALDVPSTAARGAHLTANLLGLVGLVIGGTMPFFAATVGRSRMSPRATAKRLALTLGWQVAMLAIAVSALAADSEAVAAIGLSGYALGVVATVESLPRPTRRQLKWAGPRLVAMWAGSAWWVIAVVATAVDVASDRVVFLGRWLPALVIAGYAQILWGSLAYLLPMLRGGGHERLGEGFAVTRSWLGFAVANLAGANLVASGPTVVTTVLVAVWVLDSAWRAVRVGTARAPRPRPDGGV